MLGDNSCLANFSASLCSSFCSDVNPSLAIKTVIKIARVLTNIIYMPMLLADRLTIDAPSAGQPSD